MTSVNIAPERMDSDSEKPVSQQRREALKKFGRYAALAPTVMVLLEPSEGHAGRRRRGGGGGSQY